MRPQRLQPLPRLPATQMSLHTHLCVIYLNQICKRNAVGAQRIARFLKKTGIISLLSGNVHAPSVFVRQFIRYEGSAKDFCCPKKSDDSSANIMEAIHSQIKKSTCVG
jgi:hypothetical protein